MSENAGDPVVVGVDGSASALDAVRLAVRAAAARHRPLRVVHAFIWPLLHAPVGPPPLGPSSGGLRHQAERILAEAVAEAEKEAPGLSVQGLVADGTAAAVLLHEARRAALIVLGTRGLGGFGALVIGSTAVQVAEYATCPVLVARGEERTSGPIVVGVDGSDMSDLAIGFAVEEAARRGAEVLAVHAYLHPVPIEPGDVVPMVYDEDALKSEEERLVAESLAGWSERYPDVPVRRKIDRGSAGRILVEESKAAQLVVVGARGRGGFAGLLLGSVSHGVLHHAHCPVAIVRRHGAAA
ncbi:MAG TPA: universal stress protein [Micromonosporaceae bacterium]|nr:universal stress protein [Micromonosporaceae bacterium]